MTNLLHTPEVLYKINSTLDEEQSFQIINSFAETFSNYHLYASVEKGLDVVLNLVNFFSKFHGRVKVFSESNLTINSSVPIDVLRYKMIFDGSYYHLSTDPFSYKNGYIVEGCYWSNGFYHLTREENSIKPISILFYIDPSTKDLHKYP